MKLFTSLFIAILAVVMFQGCIKDKGNYSYNDINQLSIKTALPDTFTVMIQDTLKIDLEMLQSIPSKEGLSYDWVLYPGSAAGYRVQVSDSSKVRFFIKEEPKVYDLDLFVTDKSNNVSFYKKFYVNVTSVYSQGWLVMEENNGRNDIAIIQPSNTIVHELYSKSNNNTFLPSGRGRIAVFSRRTEQIIYFLTGNDGVQVSPGTFVRNSRLKDWFYLDPGPIKPIDVFSQSTEEHFLTEDKAYGNNLNAPSPNKFGLASVGNYYLAPYQISSAGQFIFYDTIAQRYWFRAVGNGDFSLININTVAAAPWDLNKVGKRLLFAGLSTGSTFTSVFESKQRDSLFVLRGLVNGINSVAQFVDTLPAGLPLQAASQYLAARLVPQIFFTVDNKLYVWDLLAKSHRLIYTFPAGAEIRRMKWYVNSKSSSDPDNNRLLMVASQEGAEGKVYLLSTELTGDITGGTYRNVYGGFGQIRDVTYKNTP